MTETENTGRSVTIELWGASAEDLEWGALDKAREFFGGDPVLEIESGYQARFWADRRQFHAPIKVNEVPRG